MSKQQETLQTATYTDVSGQQKPMFEIEKKDEKFVVRNMFDNSLAYEGMYHKGFDTYKEALDWMFRTKTKDLF